jgi:hypothetical protein
MFLSDTLDLPWVTTVTWQDGAARNINTHMEWAVVARRKLRGKKFLRGVPLLPGFLLAEWNGCRLFTSQRLGEKNKKKPFTAAIDNLSLHEAGSNLKIPSLPDREAKCRHVAEEPRKLDGRDQ